MRHSGYSAVHTPGILSLLRIDGSVLWSWLSSSRMRSVIIVHARCRGSTRGRSRRWWRLVCWLMSVSARVCIVMLKMRQGFIAPIKNVIIGRINTEWTAISYYCYWAMHPTKEFNSLIQPTAVEYTILKVSFFTLFGLGSKISVQSHPSVNCGRIPSSLHKGLCGRISLSTLRWLWNIMQACGKHGYVETNQPSQYHFFLMIASLYLVLCWLYVT